MQRSGSLLWKCGRGVVALALALFLIVTALTHTEGHIAARLPMISVATVSLACVLVGIWKGRTLEIMAWVALLLTMFAAFMG